MSSLILITCLLCTYILHRIYRSQKRRSLPPGPKGYPIVGNIYDVPPSEEWIAYKAMSEKYKSDIIYLNLAGTDVIVLNSRDSCKELLENRSLIYSDRPNFAMLNDLVGFSWHLGFMRYGELWKDPRALLQRELNSPRKYYPSIVDATRTLLCRLRDDPEHFMQHLRHMAGMIILSNAYGIDVKPSNDPFVEIAEKGLHAMAETGNPGSFLVDSIPILKYTPEWFPGAGFKKIAKEFRKSVAAMPIFPLEFVKRSMADGTAKPSIASRHLVEMEEEGTWSSHKEGILASALGSMYAAGADTTVSAIGTFILAMLLYPEVQKKAQAEIDRVLGGDRLPEFSDEGCVPYIDAVLMEVLRWRPVTPIGVAHRVTQDDEYNGYHIPARSIVVGNSWAILNDPDIYGPDTDVFNPERFLTKDGILNPDVEAPGAAFGFGRRVCPGQALAEVSIWFAIISILTCFDLEMPLRTNGERIEPAGTYSSGLLCYPDPFRCVFRPRSAQAEVIIRTIL